MARPLGCAALEYPPLSTAPLRPWGGHMRARTVQTWIAPSYLGASSSGERLHELPLIFDGRDQETFARRSCPVFWTAQIPILEDVESP